MVPFLVYGGALVVESTPVKTDRYAVLARTKPIRGDLRRPNCGGKAGEGPDVPSML